MRDKGLLAILIMGGVAALCDLIFFFYTMGALIAYLVDVHFFPNSFTIIATILIILNVTITLIIIAFLLKRRLELKRD